MKKYVVFLIAIMSLVLVGCAPREGSSNALEDAIDNMQTEDNLTMNMEINAGVMRITAVGYVDGSNSYITMDLLEMETYVFTVDGVVYQAVKSSLSSWEVSTYEDTQDLIDQAMAGGLLGEDFSVEDFEYNEDSGFYEGVMDFDGEETTVKIKIEDGFVTVMNISANVEGQSVEINIELSNFGTTEVTIPSELITMAENGDITFDPDNYSLENIEETIYAGDTIDATLTSNGYLVFQIIVETDGYVTLACDSELDTYGKLVDGVDNLINEDDDSGYSLNFSINQYLSVGTYYLIVTGYDESNFGPVTITFEQN